MYSNEPNYKSYIGAVKEWDKKDETYECVFMILGKSDCAKIANAIRNAGYTVITEDSSLAGGYGLYQLTVSRKEV
jgi:hypothetical protein